jgi:hypothetical protein
VTYYVALGAEPREVRGDRLGLAIVFVSFLAVWRLFGSSLYARYPHTSNATDAAVLIAEPPPLCSCLFLHGAGNGFSAAPRTSNPGYWGSIESLLSEQCSRSLFMIEDTLHVRQRRRSAIQPRAAPL